MFEHFFSSFYTFSFSSIFFLLIPFFSLANYLQCNCCTFYIVFLFHNSLIITLLAELFFIYVYIYTLVSWCIFSKMLSIIYDFFFFVKKLFNRELWEYYQWKKCKLKNLISKEAQMKRDRRKKSFFFIGKVFKKMYFFLNLIIWKGN